MTLISNKLNEVHTNIWDNYNLSSQSKSIDTIIWYISILAKYRSSIYEEKLYI